jgi:hypothetical protein
MVAFATASAAANNSASAECVYLLVMLCAWQAGDRWLAVSEIGGETSKAVADKI